MATGAPFCEDAFDLVEQGEAIEVLKDCVDVTGSLIYGESYPKRLPGLVNVYITMERSTMLSMGIHPLFRLGHFQ
jgi:hypothetical protein